ncbi:Krueppel-like factor 12 isoform X1 [Limulus polyphemus]|uniref:Krueppel-like factor 12 isoform X1 n=1 Tax=Limulus polyphemus TaxID=6850 RepID=A0ABM1TNG0_LIMPO|nr:Krueppel-like factor 12 isoform X1 [Limulus polyphemus]
MKFALIYFFHNNAIEICRSDSILGYENEENPLIRVNEIVRVWCRPRQKRKSSSNTNSNSSLEAENNKCVELDINTTTSSNSTSNVRIENVSTFAAKVLAVADTREVLLHVDVSEDILGGGALSGSIDESCKKKTCLDEDISERKLDTKYDLKDIKVEIETKYACDNSFKTNLLSNSVYEIFDSGEENLRSGALSGSTDEACKKETCLDEDTSERKLDTKYDLKDLKVEIETKYACDNSFKTNLLSNSVCEIFDSKEENSDSKSMMEIVKTEESCVSALSQDEVLHKKEETEIEEAVGMVPGMEAEEKLKAVQFWNVVSEKLQEIVNNSAADINAVALKMEKENAEKLTLSSQQQTSSLPSQEEKTAFMTTAGSFSTHDEFQGTTVYRENGTLSTDQSLVYLSGNTLPDPSLNSSAPSHTHPSSDIQKLSPVSPSLPPAAAVLMDSSEQSSTFETQPCEAQSTSSDIKSWTDPKDVTKISNSSKVTNTDISQNSSPKASNTSNSENITDIIESNDESDSDEEVADLVNEDSADNIDQKTTEIVVIQSEGVDRKRGRRSRVGDDTKNLSCEWCLRQFPHISSLTSHRMVHMKPYECKECKARFSNKGNLTVHQRRHTGEKPYSCDNCNAKFSTKGNLRRHVRTHSGENREKPWQCPHCGGCFTEKKSLTVHMRRHTGERPYK